MVGSISFFVNAGVRFITESARCAPSSICGTRSPRALRRARPGAAPLPLRRAGELAGADRAAAGEQRLSHLALDAGGDAVEEGARPRRAAPGLERGAGPAAAVGPAMVAQVQQIVAYETDLLDYGDIFDGSVEIDTQVEELKAEARAELAKLHWRNGRRRGGHR